MQTNLHLAHTLSLTSFERIKSLAEDASFYPCIRHCISKTAVCTRTGLYVHTYTHNFLYTPPSVKSSHILPNIWQRWLSPSPWHFKKMYVVKFTFMLMNAEWFYFESHFTSKASADWRRGDWGKMSAVYSFLMGESGGAGNDLLSSFWWPVTGPGSLRCWSVFQGTAGHFAGSQLVSVIL